MAACSICNLPLMGTVGSPVNCAHYFHFGCLEQWSKSNAVDGRCRCPVATCDKTFVCMEVQTMIQSSSSLFFPIGLSHRCPLCKGFIQSWTTSLNGCDHYFCIDCFPKLVSGKHFCPIDRKPFTVLYKSECIGAPIRFPTFLKEPIVEELPENVFLLKEYTEEDAEQ